MKIVILGSCRFEPYDIIMVPRKVKGKWNTEEGYQIAKKLFAPSIELADEVWVYAPDGLGIHTKRDLDYARKQGKTIRFIMDEGLIECLERF